MKIQHRTDNKNGNTLSILGMGCMRFPRKGNQIDMEKTTVLIKKAVEQGVNYFDTAYIYPGSEDALGKALETLALRKDVHIATKLPILLCKSPDDLDKYFNAQLSRLKTDYIDYYLIHMLCDTGTWKRLEELGIRQWIEQKKASGQIRSIGFSYHGGRMEFARLLEAYDWDFCMIQYNYLDENNQAGRSGLMAANEKGLPVFIMEPLRGGMLANRLPPAAVDIFKKAHPDRSTAAWSLLWLWNQPQVTMVLSGMTHETDLTENTGLAQTALPGCLSEEELAVYPKVLEELAKAYKIPCTACGYCLPCPMGVDIPTCFSCYNESYCQGFITGVKHYFMTTGAVSAEQSNAGKCIECGKCEKHCPQGISIRKRLTEVRRRMESFWFKPATAIMRRVTRNR